MKKHAAFLRYSNTLKKAAYDLSKVFILAPVLHESLTCVTSIRSKGIQCIKAPYDYLPSPAITTPTGLSSCKTSIVPSCASNTSRNFR